MNNLRVNELSASYLSRLDAAIFDIISSLDISEFDLIKKLQSPPYTLFNADTLATPLSLFHTHFLVFNALHRLDNLGREQQLYFIEVNPLKIKYRLYNENNSELYDLIQSDQGHMKVKSFYTDWANFEMPIEDIEELLNSFWDRLVKREGSNLTEALAQLEFQQLPERTELKKRFKQLSQTHHPDKGGCSEKFKKVVTAYRVLLAHY